MRTLLLIAMSFSFAACAKFDRNQFITESFGVDLSSFLGTDSTYVDGRLDIRGIKPLSPLYSRFFADPIASQVSTDGAVEGPGDTIEAASSGGYRYRVLENFDGHSKVVVYLPTQERIIFIYATGVL